MAYSKQQQDGGFESAKSKFIGLDGGLQLKSDPFLTQPPSVTTAQNVWNITPGQVRSLPPLQQGNYASASTYPIYGLYVHEPTDPYTTGDVLVHTEVQDTPTGLTFPSLLSGQGFGKGGQGLASPLLPGNLKSRPFLTNTANSAAQTVPAGNYAPIYIPSATLGYGILLTPTNFAVNFGVSATCTLSFSIIDKASNTALDNPISITSTIAGPGTTQTYMAYDAIESPTTPGLFYVAFAGADGGASLYVYTVQLSFGATGVQPTLTSVVASGSTLGLVNTYAPYIQFQFINFNNTTYLVYVHDVSNIAFVPITGTTVGTIITKPLAISQIGAWVDDLNSTCFIAGPNGTGLLLQGFSTSLVGGSVITVSLPSSFGRPPCVAGYAKGGILGLWFSSLVSYTASLGFGASSVVGTFSYTYTYTGTAITARTGPHQFVSQAGTKIVSQGRALPGGTDGMVCARTGSVDYGSPTNSYAQPTYYLLDAKCRVLGRAMDGLGPAEKLTVSTPSMFCLPPITSFVSPNNGAIAQYLVTIWRNVVEGFNQGPYTATQLNSGAAFSVGGIGPPNIVFYEPAMLILTTPENLGVAPSPIAGRSQLLSGGLAMLHDGKNLVEAGFHESPHWMSTSGNAPVAGSTNPAGIYLYRCIYRWIDANGQIHRSAPSPVLSVTQAATWASQVVNIPNISTTFRTTNQTLAVELYRTDNSGTVFYLVTTAYIPAATALGSTPTASDLFTQVTDSMPTTASASFGVAYPGYWQSSYESSPPPSFIWQVTAQGRVFGLAQVDGGYRVYYSNVWTPGVTVEFNVQGYLTCPPELGDCRSLDVLDDKVMIFGTVGVGFFNGAGPGVTPGTNGIDLDINNPAFSPITPIPNAAGVVGTGCPVEIPSGVLYQSYEGILEIDRSLKSTPVGAAVDNITGTYGQAQVVYGQGILLSKLQAVLFTNPSGDSLLFDYNQRKWTTWTNAAVGPISGAVQRRDGTIYIAQQPVVSGTLPATFTANGATVNSGVSVLYSPTNPANVLASVTGITQPQYQVETPWLWSGDIPGGEGDVWEAGILGTYYNPHILKVEVATNYQAYGIIAGDTQSFPVNAAPYPSYQFRVHPPVTSRIWAVRFRITVLPPATGTITTFDLARITGIMLFSGSMQGNTRIGAGVSR